MRWLFWILLILSLATGLALIAGSNHGYVLIVLPPYRLELSLNLLLLLIVLVFVVLHLVLRLYHYTRRLPTNIRNKKDLQRLKNGHEALIESLHGLVEGHYKKAEAAASNALKFGENSGLSALIAARAAHKLKHKSNRDRFLLEASRFAPQTVIARLLLQAEMLLDDREYNQAKLVLQKLDEIEPNHPQAQRLALKVHMRLKQWTQVLSILQQIEGSEILETWQLAEYRQQAHQYFIRLYADDKAALAAYWNKMPEQDRLDKHNASLAAQTLIQAGAGNEAAEILQACLTRYWDSELAELFGRCIATDPQRQLQQAEQWLVEHQNDAQLLLSLGNLSLRLGLMDKAQGYLQASDRIKPSALAYLALARMAEAEGDIVAANAHYRHSAELNWAE